MSDPNDFSEHVVVYYLDRGHYVRGEKTKAKKKKQLQNQKHYSTFEKHNRKWET